MSKTTMHYSLSMAGLFRVAVVAALCAVLSVCASTPEELPEGRIKDRFEAFDTNGDGMITWKEFRSKTRKTPQRQARQRFNRYDLDRDGIIKKEEVIKIQDSL